MTIIEPDDGKSYGMSAVANWVEEDDFPMTKDELESKFGDRKIMLSFEESVKFSDVLEHVDETEYEDLVTMWQALGEGFRAVNPRVQERYLEE